MDIREEHEFLYHYTTQQGLKGILDTQTLHATHYKSLNDTTEMRRLSLDLVDVVELALKPEIEKRISNDASVKKSFLDQYDNIDKGAKNIASRILDIIESATFGSETFDGTFEPYVVSFCGHKNEYQQENGLLSQWRGYGKHAGYAIKVDAKKLEKLLNKDAEDYWHTGGIIDEVVYDNQKEKFEKEFKILIEVIRNLSPKMLLGPLGPNEYTPIYSPYVESACRYKHHAFQEENEVRLVFSPLRKMELAPKKEPSRQIKQVHFKDGFIPYIKLFENEDDVLPITKIIVGPHRKKEEKRNRLLKYMDTKQLDIEVTCSETPLI